MCVTERPTKPKTLEKPMTRKLASVRRIDHVVPHKNADRLEVAILGGWPAIVPKGQYSAGDLVVFCEVDSLLPPHPAYDFLAGSSSYRQPDGTVVYRIKTIRMRGQLSQGLVLPLSILGPLRDTPLLEGQDVTGELGITKYELPGGGNGGTGTRFPSFIPKTDEERIQNTDMRSVAGRVFHVSEKLDGSSCTVFSSEDGRVGVCSRNLELDEVPNNNRFWTAARASGAVSALQECTLQLAIQGEVVGPGIQGNPYDLNENRFFAFNVYDIRAQQYLPKQQFLDFCRSWGILTVPVFGELTCPRTREDVLSLAEGKSLLNPGVEREGLVWVNDDAFRLSFKSVSNSWLLESGK